LCAIGFFSLSLNRPTGQNIRLAANTPTATVQKQVIRDAMFLATTLYRQWWRFSSPLFAGRFAARTTNAVANSFVTLAGNRVGQPVEGLGDAQPNVRPGRRALRLSHICAIFFPSIWVAVR
jgi:hypothetical protein